MKGPPLVVFTAPSMTKEVPARLIPTMPVVLRLPVIVVVPDPADCRMDVAEMDPVVMLSALVKVRAPNGIEPPAAPPMRMSALPALMVSLPGPSTALARVISCDEVVKEGLFDVTTPSLKKIGPFPLMDPLICEVPRPSCVKDPSTTQAPEILRSPALVIWMRPLFVVVTVPFNVTLNPVIVMPAAVVIFVALFKVIVPLPEVCESVVEVRPLNVALPAEVMMTPPSGLILPIFPIQEIFPVPVVNVSTWVSTVAASTVLLKVMEPGPVSESKVMFPARVIGPVKAIAALSVERFPLMDVDPEPLCVKEPSEKIVPAAVLVNRPLLLTTIGPSFVVVQFPSRTKFVPVRFMPEEPLVDTSPLNVVVPVPACWVRDPTSTSCRATSLAVTIVTDAIDVTEPMSSLKVISPPPELTERVLGPSRVFMKLISPLPALESKIDGPNRVTVLAKEIGPFNVVNKPAKFTGPVPFCV